MKELSRDLVLWYRKNKRDLPWRRTRDIYKVWLSEVILQQTRVEQGLPYYERFLAAFPDVKSLAKAGEEEVLKLWEGLGYYSRARNLHAGAKMIRKELKGKFPRSYEEWLSIKGVGAYTAAAIASFCFEEPRPVLDGNVYRLMCRILGIKKPVGSTAVKSEIMETLHEMIRNASPSEFNQALMEFGALYCKPGKPDCRECVLLPYCFAGQKGIAGNLPVKKKKSAVRERYFSYFFTVYKNKVLVRRRTEGDIWKGLFEFPMIESGGKLSLPFFLKKRKLRRSQVILHGAPVHAVHKLSHQTLHCHIFRLEAKVKPAAEKGEQWVPLTELDRIPFPRLLTRFIHGHVKG